jgi:hypothetical protein
MKNKRKLERKGTGMNREGLKDVRKEAGMWVDVPSRLSKEHYEMPLGRRVDCNTIEYCAFRTIRSGAR